MLGLIAAALLVGGFGPVEASALAAVVALLIGSSSCLPCIGLTRQAFWVAGLSHLLAAWEIPALHQLSGVDCSWISLAVARHELFPPWPPTLNQRSELAKVAGILAIP